MNSLQRLQRGPGLRSVCVLVAGLMGLIGLAAASGSPAESDVPTTDPLRLSGFGTVGVSRASAPAGWGFQRDSTQPANDGGTRLDTDSRLGLQANYTVNPRFDLVGQLLLTRRLSAAPAGDAVAWAFAAYRPTEGLALRAGRISVNLYQLSDYRSVGLAYPFVRPPTEFYSLLPSAIDGLDATQSWRDGSDAIWKLSGYHGQTKQTNNGSRGFRAIRPIYGMFVSREEQGLLVKASVSRIRLADSVPEAAPLVAALQPLTGLPLPQVAAEAAALQRPFQAGSAFNYLGLGLQLDRDDWLLIMEASHAIQRGAVSLDAGYGLLGHRFGAFTPYAAVHAVRSKAQAPRPQWEAALTPVIGPAAAAQVQALGSMAFTAATSGPHQRTLSLGLRWDRSAETAVKLQVDRTRIGARGSLLWSNGSSEAANAHVLSASFDFVF